MPRKKRPASDFPPEFRAVWRNAPNLKTCRKFRRVSADRFIAHVKEDKCERCLAIYRQMEKEMNMICFLMENKELKDIIARVSSATQNTSFVGLRLQSCVPEELLGSCRNANEEARF